MYRGEKRPKITLINNFLRVNKVVYELHILEIPDLKSHSDHEDKKNTREIWRILFTVKDLLTLESNGKCLFLIFLLNLAIVHSFIPLIVLNLLFLSYNTLQSRGVFAENNNNDCDERRHCVQLYSKSKTRFISIFLSIAAC